MFLVCLAASSTLMHYNTAQQTQSFTPSTAGVFCWRYCCCCLYCCCYCLISSVCCVASPTQHFSSIYFYFSASVLALFCPCSALAGSSTLIFPTLFTQKSRACEHALRNATDEPTTYTQHATWLARRLTADEPATQTSNPQNANIQSFISNRHPTAIGPSNLQPFQQPTILQPSSLLPVLQPPAIHAIKRTYNQSVNQPPMQHRISCLLFCDLSVFCFYTHFRHPLQATVHRPSVQLTSCPPSLQTTAYQLPLAVSAAG